MDDSKNTVTGQCDHIVGLKGSYDWGDGDRDSERLVTQSEQARSTELDEEFNYCPCCGTSLAGK
jgi:hypothetical protein